MFCVDGMYSWNIEDSGWVILFDEGVKDSDMPGKESVVANQRWKSNPCHNTAIGNRESLPIFSRPPHMATIRSRASMCIAISLALPVMICSKINNTHDLG